jgi:hypothetical protein
MAYFPSIAIGVPFFRAFDLIDPQASAFYDRVIADGGVVPTGLVGVSSTFKAIKAIYGVTDITAAISVFYDAHYLAYKLGTGTGTTLGQACAKLYSACGASGDAVQATLANQPLLLAHSGVNYYQGVGVLNNSITTPNAAANNITGDIEIIWNITSLNISSISQIVGKFGTSFCYNVYQWSSQRLYFETQYGAVISSNHGVTSGTNIWFKITRTSSNGNISFFKSTDGVTYTLINTDTTKAAGALSTGGTLDVFNSDPQVAKLFRLTISNSIGGTPVVDFNPQTYSAATSQTQWTSTTGEVWTINTATATTGYKGVFVDRTIVQGDGVDDNLTDSSFTSTQAYSEYIAHRRLGTGNLVAKATGNSLSNNATNFILNNGVALNFANTSLLRQLITTRNNGASSGQAINNGTETTGNAGTNNGTTLVIGGGNFGINTYIQSILNDGSTVRTAMYNFIKTLNNSAF